MLQTNKIKIRDLKELQADDVLIPKNTLTPLRKRKNAKSAAKSKKVIVQKQEQDNKNIIVDNTVTKIATKKLLKSAIKETPTNQKRIDSYFTSCPKTYEINITKKEPATQCVRTKLKTSAKKTKSANKNKKSPMRRKLRRKRLFSDTTDATVDQMSVVSSIREIKMETVCITIDSDSEDEPAIKNEVQSPAGTLQTKTNTPPATVINFADNPASSSSRETSLADKSQTFPSSTSASSLPFGLRMSDTSCGQTKTSSKTTTGRTSVTRRKTKPCPPYKIIENTTFAVDAFQFGYIDNVTHYFLTHFHADHYIGLTKSFNMPLYMSSITARLLRTFIPVQEQYIHELELNEPCIINDIEVTALDANHCPGSILLVFKFPQTNKCILHTGDFRAWHGMESEPIFWNNPIHTIYLDTTYISDKYSFCTQDESITKAKVLIDQFIEKHSGKRILYICGSYIIGKEKFWSKLAEEYDLKVWAEGNRYKALNAMNEEQFNKLLVEDPNEANMHVLAMAKVTYLELVEYFKSYQHLYDIVFAIRPSGWEKNSKPRYGGKINIIGIEYSEHSSYTEMQRFVKYLKPQQVLSTVPTGRDLMKTAKIPINWYKYNILKPTSNYQPSIDSFMARTPQTNSSLRSLITRRGSVDNFVSPLKSITPNHGEINNNFDTATAISRVSSKPTNIKEIVNDIKTEINSTQTLNQVNSYNLLLNTPHLTKTTTSKCSGNSTEDFERPDLVITSKKIQRIKKEVNNKKQTNNKVKTKTKKSEKTLAYTTRKLQQKNTNIKERNNSNSSEDSADLFQHERNTISAKLQKNLGKSKENPILKSTTTSIYSISDDELPTTSYKKSLKTKTPASSGKSSKEKYDIINDSNNSNVFNHRYLPDIKEESEEINIDTKENIEKETGFYKYKMSNGHKQNSTKQCNISEGINYRILPHPPTPSNKTYTEHEPINLSQKRITRSKSASSKATTSSHPSQNNNEQEFENKLRKITHKNNKMNNNKSQQNSTRILGKIKENPIYKSTTTTSIDSRSEEELPMNNFLPKPFITNTLTGSERSSEEERGCMRNTKYIKSGIKRTNSNHNSTPFKKSNTLSLNTTAILNNILEHNEDFDRFNCSQLAGLVVNSIHKHNPDNSKDHIPSELLSDADDDWM